MTLSRMQRTGGAPETRQAERPPYNRNFQRHILDNRLVEAPI
jgi:hypothetical protein